MPSCFKETYPTTRINIDCAEIYIEKPSPVKYQSATYSAYTHYNTAKEFIGITLIGAISLYQILNTGRTSDGIAAKGSKLYDLLENRDSVMTDKSFNIANDLPEDVSINIPPFLRGKEHLSAQEETETKQIAAVYISVERVLKLLQFAFILKTVLKIFNVYISRIKTLQILSTVFLIILGADLNKIWVIGFYLTNFLTPLINES